MTTQLFQPKSETGKSQGEMVYDLLRHLDFGDTLTYETVERETGLDLRSNRGPMYDAIKRLEDGDQRTAECVTSVGYRVVQPVEHGRLALKHHRRSRRQLRQASRKVASADRTKMTATEAQRLNDLQVVVSRHEQTLGRITRQMKQMDDAIKQSRQEQQEKHGELSDQVSRLEEALRKRNLLDEQE